VNQITILTNKQKEVLDVTEKVGSHLKISEGMIFIFIMHTTASLTTADLDPGTDLDFLDAIEAIAPKLKYRHPHDPSHTNDHIMSSIIGSSVSIPVSKGKLVLGTWQRIILVELNGPMERNIVINQIDLS